jgi:hypothetical protein
MSAICAAYEAGVQEGAAGAEDQLQQTVADLAECEAELSVLDADLGICEADMGAVETALGTCESELASVQVALVNFFDSVPNCACWETYMSLDSCSGAGATLVGVSGTTLFGFHPDQAGRLRQLHARFRRSSQGRQRRIGSDRRGHG